MKFSIITTHRLCMRGEPVEPGTRLDLSAAEAQSLLDCRRAELVDADDASALRQALADEFAAQAAAAPVFGQTPEQAARQVADAEQAFKPRQRIGFLP